MAPQQEEAEQASKACVLCGNEFSGKFEVCPDDGTLLTPIGKEPKTGDIIADRYEILGVLGDGGMGKVYKARHTLMKRVVAIKMLLPHLVQSGPTLKRFQQEAQAASALKHPHIMTVHDFGITDKGMPYLVMDYLEGMSLATLLQEIGTVPQDRAVNIFIQACSALSHAHKNGVVHRDLKPANLMLIDFDGQPDFLMVVDFGIAKLLQPDGTAEQLTHTGEVFGSPLYMSPEQCRGKELDPRSDIYSLGCVIYRSVTGRPVFGGRDAMECMYKQVNDLPGSFGDVCPELGLCDKLEAAVFKAIAKEADERFQTMAEFREALEEVQAPAAPVHRVFAVPPQSGQEVAFDMATDKLHRPREMASTQLADGAGGDHAQPHASSGNVLGLPSADSAALHYEEKKSASAESEGVTSTVAAVPNSSSFSNLSAEETTQSSSASSSLPSSAPIDTSQIGSSPGSVTLSVNSLPPGQQSDSQIGPGQSIQNLSAVGQSSRVVESGTNATQKQFLIAAGLGVLLLIGGAVIVSLSSKHNGVNDKASTTVTDSTVAESSNTAAASGTEPVIDKNTPAGAKVTEAQTLIATGNYQNAEKSLSKAADAAGTDLELAKVLPLQAKVLEESGKDAQAQETWQKLLSIQEKSGASEPDKARTKSKLAMPMFALGDVDGAEKLLKEAENVLANAAKPDKVGLSQVYFGLSKVALSRRDYMQAIETLKQAINRTIEVRGPAAPALVDYYQTLSMIYLGQGRLIDSEDIAQQMLKLAEANFGKNSAQVADAYKVLGAVSFQKGRVAKADELLNKSLTIRSKDFGDDSLAAAEVMATLGMVYTRERKFGLAEKLFQKSLAIRTKELGADSPEAVRTKGLYDTFLKAKQSR